MAPIRGVSTPAGLVSRVRRKLSDLRAAGAYRAAVDRHREQLPALGEGDRRIVEALRREKVVVTSLDELGLPDTDSFWESARALMRELPPAGPGRDYVCRSTPESTLAQRAFVECGLQDRLLDIMENAIGLPPAVREINVRRNYTDERECGSRLWHIDRDDHCVVRVIVYLHDVGPDAGPFECVPVGARGGLSSLLIWSSARRDETLRRFVPGSWIRTCTGPAGTVIFAATSQVLHHGRIPVDTDRYAAFFNFNSRSPRRADCRPTWPLETVRELAEKLPERQRACLLW